MNCPWVPCITGNDTTCHSYCQSVQQITLTNLLQLGSPIQITSSNQYPRKFLLTISIGHGLLICGPLGATTSLPPIHVAPVHMVPVHAPPICMPPIYMPLAHSLPGCWPPLGRLLPFLLAKNIKHKKVTYTSMHYRYKH